MSHIVKCCRSLKVLYSEILHLFRHSIIVYVPSEDLQYFCLCVCYSFLQSPNQNMPLIARMLLAIGKKMCDIWAPKWHSTKHPPTKSALFCCPWKDTQKTWEVKTHNIESFVKMCVHHPLFQTVANFMDNAGALLYIPHHTSAIKFWTSITVFTGSFPQLFGGKF